MDLSNQKITAMMLRSDHPNAKFLMELYQRMYPDSTSPGNKEQVHEEIRKFSERVSRDFLIHPAGHRNRNLAHGEAAESLGRRRLELSNGTFTMEPIGALAHDTYGLIEGRCRATRADRRIDLLGCGLWRFKNGVAVEHWELIEDPNAWDAFWADE